MCPVSPLLSFSCLLALLTPGLLPERNNVEQLYAKVLKPRKKLNRDMSKESKEPLTNGSPHAIEDSSPPPAHIAGKSEEHAEHMRWPYAYWDCYLMTAVTGIVR